MKAVRQVCAALLTLCACSGTLLAQGAQQAVPGVNGAAGPGENIDKPAPVTISARLGVVLPAAMPTEELPLLDLAPVWDQLDGPPGEAMREGIDRAMPFFDMGMGQWLEVVPEKGGGWLWVLDVKSPGAFGVRLHFTQFDLPDGAEMVVYDPAIPQNLPSPYTGAGPRERGDFYAWTCWGETARVEVYFPLSVGAQRFEPSFVIDKFAHIYRNPVTGSIGYFNDRELGCHLDRTCYSNWWQVGDSVARMQFPTSPGFIGNCSGAMLNHSGDLAPLFLTARHCMQDISSRLDNLEVYWFYQSSTCGGPPPDINNIGLVPRSVGSSYVLTTAVNDMSLVMIDGTVPRNAFWAGTAYIDHVPEDWNIVGIHHPRGAHKRISFGDIWDEYDSCSATNMSQGAEIDWDAGLIEPGSSGSPMFLTDGRVVGVASCNELPHDCGQDSSYYGRWGSYVSDYPNVMTSASWDDSNENNDSCGAATNLNNYYNGTMYSQIVKIYDEDWFRVTVPAFGTCTFRSVFTHADGDIDMKLHDGCGAQIGSSTSVNNSETITWNNPGNTPREVYCRVYLYNDTRNIYYLDFSRWGPSAPANDTCSSPQPIVVGGTYSGTTLAAAANGQASCGTSNASPDVYFTLVPSCTQEVVIDTFGSAYDTVLSATYLVCGSADPFVEFDCNDDSAGTYQSQISFPATAGTTYYVRVSGYNGAFGNFNLRVQGLAPSHDNCANAPYLEALGGTVHFSNCAATTDGPPDDVCMAFNSNQIYRDVWYTYIAPCEGTLSLDTFGSGWDTKLAVYANPDNSVCPPGPNSAIACNDDANAALESQIIMNVLPGQRYTYRVGSYNQNFGSTGQLRTTFYPAVRTDDTCDGATAAAPGSYAWYTCGYDTEGPLELCGADGQVYNDRWFSYTPSCDGTLDFNTVGSGLDTRIAIYGACPDGDYQAIDCNDNYSPTVSVESQLFTPVVANTTYLLRVGNWAEGASGGLSMNISFIPGGSCVVCDSIDYNNDGLFPDTMDIDDFLSVFSGGPCSNDPLCGDIDFNNDGLFPDTLDIDSLLSVFSGGSCL